KNKDYHVFINKQSTGISFIEFHMEKPSGEYGAVYKPPFDDLRLRQAVAYAIDSDAIIKSVLDGLATRNFGPMPIGDYGYNSAIEQYGYKYDPAKAKQLLDQAGWTASGGGTRKKNGQSLTVQLWTWNATSQQQVAQVVQNQLSQVGFDVKLTTMEVATLLGRLGQDGDTSNFDLMGWGWGEPDIMYMMTNTTSGIGYYHAEDYRKLVTQARTISDLDQRAKLYFQASQVMLKDCAMVPMWSAWSATATGKGVQGFKLGPQGYFAYLDAYIEKG
ncbi:MAG TPA: ABC transporter substrate-binding protein, partial [Thermomicrobiaceae bacterium]|nr:ABC transporter substrate-binding protein [Thermomicrobiaceae bacterium]